MLDSKIELDFEKSCRENEDYRYVEKAMLGDVEAQNYLVEKYRPMILKKSRTYFLIGGDRDDIIQEGMIGFYKAIRDYKPNMSASFKHFAEICVTRQMITAVRASTRQKHIPLNTYVSFDKAPVDDESSSELFQQSMKNPDGNPEQLIIGKEDFEYLESIIDRSLSKFEKKVFILYLRGLSYRMISEVLSKDIKSIDNAIQRVKRKLEKSLENHRE